MRLRRFWRVENVVGLIFLGIGYLRAPSDAYFWIVLFILFAFFYRR